jgi:hypothetical protein
MYRQRIFDIALRYSWKRLDWKGLSETGWFRRQAFSNRSIVMRAVEPGSVWRLGICRALLFKGAESDISKGVEIVQIRYICAASLFLASSFAVAQEKYDTAPLPPICTKGAMAAMKAMSAGSPDGAMAMPTDEAHKALAAGMAKMQADMSVGMQATDIEIAFNCGMIPHHQGAISMARVELKYGTDPGNRKLAETIIKTQEKEVMGMLAWLEGRSK